MLFRGLHGPKGTGVGVEKVQFAPKQPKIGGYKMSRKLRKSFVGHPSAISFLRISRGGVFQQPQALSQVAPSIRRLLQELEVLRPYRSDTKPCGSGRAKPSG